MPRPLLGVEDPHSLIKSAVRVQKGLGDHPEDMDQLSGVDMR
jgi:hypothetical protein